MKHIASILVLLWSVFMVINYPSVTARSNFLLWLLGIMSATYSAAYLLICLIKLFDKRYHRAEW